MICLRRFCLIPVLVFALATLAAANQPAPPPNDWNVRQGIELPIYKTPWEIENERLFPIQYPPLRDPPTAPVCNPAEWEPLSGVLIRYPFGLPMNVIAEMSEDIELKTIVASTSQMNTVLNQYASGGVNIANCTFLIAPSNTYWTRDYGPWYIFTGENEQGITDHIYNRPTRPDDNNIPWVLGDTMNIPVYGMPLTHTGGNYMSDGMGIGMSTDLVYDENSSLTPAQVDEYMYQYTGNDYMVVPDINAFGIHHIDCWGKLLTPGKILIKMQDPTNTQLEANAAWYATQISSYGRPYEVVRVIGGSSQDYSNSLILNDKVFLPIFSSGYDAAAIQVYQNAMPGYQILPFTGSWVNDDAVHCRAMGIADRYMLRIVHVPAFDRVNTGQNHAIGANIHAYSDMPFIGGTPEVIWKVQGGNWQALPMTHVVGDSFVAFIPPQPDNTALLYYIHAEDDSGRNEDHPYIGSADPHHLNILPANGLDITMTPIGSTTIPPGGGSFDYNATIDNNSTLSLKFSAWVMVELPSGSPYGPVLGPVSMTLPGGGSLVRERTQTVPGSAPPGTYTYTGYVGYYAAILDSSSFTFTKSATGDAGAPVSEWVNSGASFAGEAAVTFTAASEGFRLSGAYPNPFNPVTTISFSLARSSRVNLAVYDLQGRLVAQLADGWRELGPHEVTFDASGLAAGVYFYRLETAGQTAAGKMMLLK